MTKMFDEIKTRINRQDMKANMSSTLPSFENVSVSEITKEASYFSYLTKISVEWSVQGYWSTDGREESKTLQEMTRNFVMQIREDMYGDLKDRLLRLERQIAEHPPLWADEAIQSSLRDLRGMVWGNI